MRNNSRLLQIRPIATEDWTQVVLDAVGARWVPRTFDREAFQYDLAALEMHLRDRMAAADLLERRRQEQDRISSSLRSASSELCRLLQKTEALEALLDKNVSGQLLKRYSRTRGTQAATLSAMRLGLEHLASILREKTNPRKKGRPSTVTITVGDVDFTATMQFIAAAMKVFEQHFARRAGFAETGPFVRFCQAIDSGLQPSSIKKAGTRLREVMPKK